MQRVYDKNLESFWQNMTHTGHVAWSLKEKKKEEVVHAVVEGPGEMVWSVFEKKL